MEAVFIYPVKMSPGWCVKTMDVEGKYGYYKKCIRFKNKIEELKNDHNQTKHLEAFMSIYGGHLWDAPSYVDTGRWGLSLTLVV
ncbi:MAG: hypothetical protein QME06_08450 [Desulfobacterales bacterium]|nr:hypothetical protein [Desulfobacterales bacterium]